MSQASFFHSLGSVTFSRTPRRPDQSLEVIQPTRKSAGGVRFGYAHTIIKEPFKLPVRLTTAERTALETFFNSYAKGMANTFTYQTTAGDAMLLRFAAPHLAIQEQAYENHTATLDLQVVGGVVNWSSGDQLLWSGGEVMLG